MWPNTPFLNQTNACKNNPLQWRTSQIYLAKYPIFGKDGKEMLLKQSCKLGS